MDAKIPFNNTLGKLERLSKWWDLAGMAKIDNSIDEYYNSLENIYTELYAHLNKDEIEQTDKELKIIERFLDATNSSNKESFIKNRRIGSNLCDKLARKMSVYSKKYKLEWFDIDKWAKEQKELEPIMRG